VDQPVIVLRIGEAKENKHYLSHAHIFAGTQYGRFQYKTAENVIDDYEYAKGKRHYPNRAKYPGKNIQAFFDFFNCIH
jgi:hypothetical protein